MLLGNLYIHICITSGFIFCSPSTVSFINFCQQPNRLAPSELPQFEGETCYGFLDMSSAWREYDVAA